MKERMTDRENPRKTGQPLDLLFDFSTPDPFSTPDLFEAPKAFTTSDPGPQSSQCHEFLPTSASQDCVNLPTVNFPTVKPVRVPLSFAAPDPQRSHPLVPPSPVNPSRSSSIEHPPPQTHAEPPPPPPPPRPSRQDASLTDRRGFPPKRRWRLYCFRRVFVIEPNIPGVGLRFMAEELKSLIAINRDPSDSQNASQKVSELPQLVIFRDSDVIVEVPNSTHELYKSFGPFQQLFLIDGLIGQVYIADARFLAVIADCESVAGFSSSSLSSASSAGASSAGASSVASAASSSAHALDQLIYKIHKAWLIPFHLTLEHMQLQSPIISTTARAGAMGMGMMYDDAILQRAPARSSRRRSEDADAHRDSLRVPSNQPRPQSPDFPSGSLRETHSSPTFPAHVSGTPPPADASLPVSAPRWETSGFGDAQFCSYLGDKLSSYKLSIEKLLATSFYFSYEIEMTHTVQRKRQLGVGFQPQGWPCGYRATETSTQDVKYMEIADKRFLWNFDLCHPFFAWSIDSRWLVPIIQGSVTSATLTCGIHGMDLVLICRRSCRRGGTRYNHRGLDDAGNVANFNESEQLIAACRVDPSTGNVINRGTSVAGGGWASFVQIRGSVPVFWEQLAAIAINPTPQLTRELDFAWKAFALHQRELNQLYGSVTYVNLLAGGRGGEPKLTKALAKLIYAYSSQKKKLSVSRVGSPGLIDFDDLSDSPPVELFEPALKGSGSMIMTTSERTLAESLRGREPEAATTAAGPGVRHVHWDFHHHIKAHGFEPALSGFVRTLAPDLQSFGYFCDKPHYAGGGGSQFQTGVIRTNCLDCLDRTNAFQWFLCWSWLVHYLQERGLKSFLTSGYRVAESSMPPVDAPDSAQSRPRARGVHVSSHTSDPSVHVSQRTRKPRTRRSLDDVAQGSRSPTGIKTVVVRCFSGDEKGMTFKYQVGKPVGRVAMSGGAGAGQLQPADDLGEYFPNILKDVVARMWADHGDHISKAYTGTGSVLSGLVRQGKSSLATNMGHVMTSLGRFYQNTFEDAGRQDAIELLLNQHERLSQPYVTPGATKPEELESETCDSRPPIETEGKRKAFVSELSTTTGKSTGSLKVWFGTWNLGGRRVNESLERWLMPDQAGLPTADLYIIAIQELVELTSMRILLSQNDKDKEWHLELNIKHALGPSFQMLRSHSLVGLYMSVFVRSEFRDLISEVQSTELKLGFKGQMGNKGALFMRLLVGNTSLCFINVHLTPGLDKAVQRRSQLQSVFETSFQGRASHAVRDHDCVLVGGDFNFRCDIETTQADELLDNGLVHELLERDQFITCKRLGVPPFRELMEAPITFLPTYKFRRGTNLYDRSRVPGWCDRIFYFGEHVKCALTRNWILCDLYDRVDDFLSSDHKPVFATFQVAVVLDPPKQGVAEGTPDPTRATPDPSKTRDISPVFPVEPKSPTLPFDLFNLPDPSSSSPPAPPQDSKGSHTSLMRLSRVPMKATPVPKFDTDLLDEQEDLW